jgi:hypothetical protein
MLYPVSGLVMDKANLGAPRDRVVGLHAICEKLYNPAIDLVPVDRGGASR